MGLYFLQSQVDCPLSHEQFSDYDLHTLEVFEAWNAWLLNEGKGFSWDEEAAKYNMKDASK
jgi:hypothetical protein